MKDKIGFMQGRLSPIIDGKIQAFPWKHWKEEFQIARELGFTLMEWTIDQENLHLNPLMSKAGRTEIKRLSTQSGVCVPSITGDCFMQAPFWKAANNELCKKLQSDFMAVMEASSDLQIEIVVVPLVDNGRITASKHENSLIEFLSFQENRLNELGVKIAFEVDFAPNDVKRFINRFENVNFGINYDIGNSAFLAFDPLQEFVAYGDRILNVHVKDRTLNGNTVPLGMGSANFTKISAQLKTINYRKNYILQTARAKDGAHSETLRNYKKFVERRLV